MMTTTTNDLIPLLKMPSLKDRRNERKKGVGDASDRNRSTSNGNFSNTLGALVFD